MKTYYSSSKYANYAHIHMYIFFNALTNELQKAHVDGKDSYKIDVDIDGNVAIWKFDAKDPRAEYIFNELKDSASYITKDAIKKATKAIAKKMGKKFEITDFDLLVSELSNIKLSEEKPEIKDDDSLEAPGIILA